MSAPDNSTPPEGDDVPLTAKQTNAPKQPLPPSAGERVQSTLSNIWRSKAMLPVRLAYYATSPVWYPTKLAAKAALWGVKRESTTAKILVPTFAAAALGTYAMTGVYLGTYATVAGGDYYWFGSAYSEGDRTGRISKLSHVGKFPCTTLEGELAMPNLGTGGSSTFSFSVRTLGPLNAEAAAAVEQAFEHDVPVSLHYKQSHWPTERFDRENGEGWFVPFIDGFACIQKSDYNIVSVVEKPNIDVPMAPRLPGGR